jgi:hydroxymethylbilane synthase
LTENPIFAIASRKSPLAQIQAMDVRKLLSTALGLDENALPLKTFISSGDRNLNGSLAEIGGKGLFTKEVEEALLNGEARFAVHSMKDMPADLPEGLVVVAIPSREDPRDCFLSPRAKSPWDLPQGATIGAASVRRIAQVLSRRPDLKTVTLRGNVQTRLEKLANGDADATFLALAGLKRLRLETRATKVMKPEEMLPAVGQGALCIEARADDEEALALAAKINCPETAICVAVERGFLAQLDGSCRTPIGGLAEIKDGHLRFRGEVLSLDGAERFFVERRIPCGGLENKAAKVLGAEAASEILEAAGEEFFKRLAQ